MDPGLGIEAPREIFQEIGMVMAEIEVGTEDKGAELLQETEGIDQGLDQAPMLAQIGIDQDAINAMNMTTLLENALTLCQMRNRMLFCNC